MEKNRQLTQISLLLPEGLLKDLHRTPEDDFVILGKYNAWKDNIGILAVKSICLLNELYSIELPENTKVLGVIRSVDKQASCSDPELLSSVIQYIPGKLNNVLIVAILNVKSNDLDEYLSIFNLYTNQLDILELKKINIIIYAGRKKQILNLSNMLKNANKCLENAIKLIETSSSVTNCLTSDAYCNFDQDIKHESLFQSYQEIMNENDFEYIDNHSIFSTKPPSELEPFFFQISKCFLFYILTLLSFTSSVIWSGVSNFPLIQTLIQKNICATISQAALRIKNQRNWMILNHILNNPKIKINEDMHNSIQILLYSSITTVIIDYIFGILFAFGVDAFSKELIILMEKSFFYIYHDAIHTQVKWLMSFPAGFKLNQNLTTVMGNLTLAALKFWCDLTSQHFSDLNHNMIFLIKFSSITCGMSVAIALIWDILNIYSFLLFFIYTIMAKLYNLNLKAIKTFFYIFRGIKSNIFSNIDHNSHYSEQLLIGTILFTIFVLILPTITAFYINFLFIWSCVYIALVLLFFTISTINTFPFYLILTRIITPNTFSSGIFLREFLSNSKNQFVLIFSHKQLGFNSICKPFSDSLGHLFEIHLDIIQIIKSILLGNILHILNLQGSKTHHFKSTFAAVEQEVDKVNGENNSTIKHCLSNGNFHHYNFDNISLSQVYKLLAELGISDIK